ncbi:ATP-binding cassette domain-containing protein [Nitratireductor sp. CAU 1489]|uniref:ATP-binding cassette domain-containing protein n=1 Tax=Nitratireductor arenosus TaxID=2682096 RepID=A0A844QJH5_9HYPH|nr:ABC transporter ATP-binding protein [Nitratireductor arenosus]MVA98163.1 ATP-binding cassette domain-containing protein [Nitratireductor arenosus]
MTVALPQPDATPALAREHSPVLAFEGFEARYPFATAAAVGPVDLAMRAGERVLLLGPSGSGKSTLLLALTGLVPQAVPAQTQGGVRLFGVSVAGCRPSDWAGRVGQFFQDADQTLCGMRVEDEIAFALENLAWPEPQIHAAVKKALAAVGLPETVRRRRTATLSGGEKQLVALAATIAVEPQLLVADEPTASLSPSSSRRFRDLLSNWPLEGTALIVDHRLDGLVDVVDRVIVLGDDGLVLADGPPRVVFRRQRAALDARGIWTPLAAALDHELDAVDLAAQTMPLTVEEALDELDARGLDGKESGRARAALTAFVDRHAPPPARAASDAPLVVRLEAAACAPFLGPVVLSEVDLDMRAGEVVGLLGANGAGKSTLGFALAGLLRLKAGRRVGAMGSVSFQNPEAQFSAGSIAAEIEAALASADDAASLPGQAARILRDWDLERLASRHPFELSQGEKRRLALACLAADERARLVVLDEPLAGLDRRGAAMVEEAVAGYVRAGRAVAIVTHDMDFALRMCPRCLILGQGRVLADGPTVTLMRDRPLMELAKLEPPRIVPALDWLERHA